MTKSILKDSSNATASSYSSARKEVAWGELTTWEFPNILGDNPSVTEGVPLSIGWKPLRQEKVGIDYYEYLRRSNTRRTRKELVQDSGVRGSLLLSQGVSLQQIMKAVEEVERIKDSRRSNMKGRFDSFKSVFLSSNSNKLKKSSQPRIIAAKSG